MRKARGLVLTLAALAAAAAVMLVRNAGPGTTPESRTVESVEVLVAARAITVGETVSPSDVRWQQWPKQALFAGAIQRPAGGAAPGFVAAPARFPMQQGEPVVEGKLARPGPGSAMASQLAAGMRGVQVPVREEALAGGFIQPQDRVDVMLARKARDGGSGAAPKGEVLLRGVKVLAITKAPEGRGGGGGATQPRIATLELTPAQSRRLVSAQGAGDLSLALVAAADAATGSTGSGDGDEPEAQPVKMLKFGRRQ